MVGAARSIAAIALLNQVRAQEPDNADALYLLAMVNFDNRRWPDGLAAAQIAVRKNPALKSDPDLIKGAIARWSAIAATIDRRVPARPGPAGDAVHQGRRRPATAARRCASGRLSCWAAAAAGGPSRGSSSSAACSSASGSESGALRTRGRA